MTPLNPEAQPAEPFDAMIVSARAFQVLRRYPSLVIFPVTAMILSMAILWGFSHGVPIDRLPRHMPEWIGHVGTFLSPRHNPHWGMIVAYYLIVLFTGSFLNTALYHELLRVYSGESPSLPRGLAFAGTRLGPIVFYTLLLSTVGVGSRLLTSRGGWILRLVGLAGSVTWGVLAVFAIPVLVRDGGYNPVAVVRRSASLVRSTWGPGIYGMIRLSFLPMLVAGGFFGFAIGLSGYLFTGPAAEIIPAIAFGLLLLVSAWISALTDIFKAALYIYATEGIVPDAFRKEDLDGCWKVSRS